LTTSNVSGLEAANIQITKERFSRIGLAAATRHLTVAPPAFPAITIIMFTLQMSVQTYGFVRSENRYGFLVNAARRGLMFFTVNPSYG